MQRRGVVPCMPGELLLPAASFATQLLFVLGHSGRQAARQPEATKTSLPVRGTCRRCAISVAFAFALRMICSEFAKVVAVAVGDLLAQAATQGSSHC